MGEEKVAADQLLAQLDELNSLSNPLQQPSSESSSPDIGSTVVDSFTAGGYSPVKNLFEECDESKSSKSAKRSADDEIIEPKRSKWDVRVDSTTDQSSSSTSKDPGKSETTVSSSCFKNGDNLDSQENSDVSSSQEQSKEKIECIYPNGLVTNGAMKPEDRSFHPMEASTSSGIETKNNDNEAQSNDKNDGEESDEEKSKEEDTENPSESMSLLKKSPKKKSPKKKKKDKDKEAGSEKDPEKEKLKKQAPKSLLRRNIHKLKTDEELNESTLAARNEEEERLRRLQDQMKKNLENLIKKNMASKLLASDDVLVVSEEEGDSQDEKSDEVIDVSSGEDELIPPPRPSAQSYKPSILNSHLNAQLDSISTRGSLYDSKFNFDQNEEDDEEEIMVLEDEEDDEDDAVNEASMALHTNDLLNIPEPDGRVLINLGHPENEPDVYLAPQLGVAAKPHQIGGIRFMYDNIVENLEKMKTSKGLGCILAHSMGLGKTFQVISFIDVFLRHTSARKVLCIVPINTLQNWLSEFDTWLPSPESYKGNIEAVENGHVVLRNFPVIVSNEKSYKERMVNVARWNREGGVLLLGYEMYRKLAQSTKQKPGEKCYDDESMLIKQALVDPGPDLVICDEGHRIKNCNASTSKALKSIATKRRVVLTGYPLQNNLLEYWCMVDFVRPNYLGTKDEFANMFQHPIENGQCIDSLPKDKLLMKYRTQILTDKLRGFVQRRSHAILKDTLPPKVEHVILCRMSQIQKELMRACLDTFKDESTNDIKGGPIALYSVLCKIWNHPDILYRIVEKENESLDDLDVDDDLPVDLEGKSKGRPRKKPADYSYSPSTSSNADSTNGKSQSDRSIDYSWAREKLKDYIPGMVENSCKMVILFKIIEESINIGDRVLIFSQSLYTLDLMEQYLQKTTIPGTQDYFAKHVNYLRIDGSTQSQEREKFVRSFNQDPKFKLFLLSTRACSLGVNLIGANRIVVFDASWNPCHDVQAACRIYRYGQIKPCFIYRLICDNSLEKKIYDRQLHKQNMSNRVVDESATEAHIFSKDIKHLIDDLLDIQEPPVETYPDSIVEGYKDDLVRTICRIMNHYITKKPHEHESLFLDQGEMKLSKKQKKAAYEQYQKALERKNKPPSTYQFPYISPTGYPNPTAASTSNIAPNPFMANIRPPPGGFIPARTTKPNYAPLRMGIAPLGIRPYSTPYNMFMDSKKNPSQSSLPESLRQNENYISLEALETLAKKPGVIVKQLVVDRDYMLPAKSMDNRSEMVQLRRAEKVFLIRTPNCLYLRVRNGRVVTLTTNPQEIEALSQKFRLTTNTSPPTFHEAPSSVGRPTKDILLPNFPPKAPEVVNLSDDEDNEPSATSGPISLLKKDTPVPNGQASHK